MSEFCSLCQEIETGPYCPNHGMVHRPFSIGDYDLDELLGAGDMSFVFGARHRAQARAVAVKILRPQVTRDSDAQQRFLHEAGALRQLTHENIVGIIEFGWDDALAVTYLVMDRLSGQTAEAMVRQHGALAWQQAVPLLVQICRAVAAADALGISDGHLTAKKVFVVQSSGPQAVKLCNFGFSSATGPSEGAEPRDDLYGIGTVAHELLTGRPPLEGSSAAGPLSDDPIRVNERFPALKLPGKLDDLIRACRLRDPMLRPSLEEIEATLQSLDVASATSARAEAVAVRATPRAQSKAVVVRATPRAQSKAAAVSATPHVQKAAAATPATPSAKDQTAPYVLESAVVEEAFALPDMIGSYRVVASLGAGGTGRVYLGQHPVIGSKVAIKVLLPEIASRAETVDRFIQEARASSQIASPHFPRYFDFGTTPDGLPYAMMEYLEGETIGDRLARTGTMSVAETAQILEQVASALLMAHEAGLIHRDLKPDNIFLVKPEGKASRSMPKRAASIGPSGSAPNVELPIHVKVLDFGIAKMIGRPSATRTQDGYFLGTPFYCAPEQVFGSEVDVRTDVYSLGVTAFEMLTGSPPFVGEVPTVMAAKATTDAPNLLDFGVPPAVAHTIGKMLARDPDERAASMAWVLDQLASWQLASWQLASWQLASWPESAEFGAASPARLEVSAGAAARTGGDPEAGIVPGRSTTAAQAADAVPALPALAVAARPDSVPPPRDGDRDPGTTSQAMRAIAPARSRVRPRVVLATAGGVLAVAVAILVIRGSVSRSRSTTGVSPRWQDVQETMAGSAVVPVVPVAPPLPPPLPPPAKSDPPAPGHGAEASETANVAAAAEATPEAAPGSDKQHGSEPARAGSGSAISRTASGASDGSASPGLAGSRRHGAKPPADKKVPVKKPPKDVLIVDPFSRPFSR